MTSDDGGAGAALAPRRLHPAGIAVLAVRSLRDLALPLGVAFVSTLAGAGGDEPLTRVIGFGVFGAVLALIAGVARWATTTWAVSDGTIRHRTGLLSRRETDVPLTRVQAVDTEHGPLQRLLGVRGVHVQTAGGGREGEIRLPAVAPADVAALRGLLDGREAAAPAALAERRLRAGDLLLAAITAGQLGVIVPVLAAAGQLVGETFGDDVGRAREGLRLVPDGPGEWALAAAALLLLAWLVSIAGAVMSFAGFTVAREEHRLRLRRGLFARREATVPVARVQAVQVVEGVLRQPFGLAALRVEVAGYAAEEAAARTLYPLLRRAEVDGFLAALLPELTGAGTPRATAATPPTAMPSAAMGAPAPPGTTPPAVLAAPLRPAPPRALRRYVVPPASAALVAAVAAAVAIPGAGLWPLLAVLPASAYGALCWRDAGWRLAGGRLLLRRRRMARVTILAPVGRLQEHAVRQTVLQRRARLADVAARVGAGTHGRVRHLDAAAAGGLFDALRDPQAVE